MHNLTIIHAEVAGYLCFDLDYVIVSSWTERRKLVSSHSSVVSANPLKSDSSTSIQAEGSQISSISTSAIQSTLSSTVHVQTPSPAINR